MLVGVLVGVVSRLLIGVEGNVFFNSIGLIYFGINKYESPRQCCSKAGMFHREHKAVF